MRGDKMMHIKSDSEISLDVTDLSHAEKPSFASIRLDQENCDLYGLIQFTTPIRRGGETEWVDDKPVGVGRLDGKLIPLHFRPSYLELVERVANLESTIQQLTAE